MLPLLDWNVAGQGLLNPEGSSAGYRRGRMKQRSWVGAYSAVTRSPSYFGCGQDFRLCRIVQDGAAGAAKVGGF